MAQIFISAGHGGDHHTQRAIADEVARAQAALAALPAGPARDALLALPEAELQRIG